ncbi:hypothetical protein [Marinospirillum perlucidum]|uniref:hypothetical protein n=1 Tax=Marinospirillum perlucidum TaxID=1982602 RepID=UPI000DF160A9|nr:hypothetical protein [Marinospirillum perlucidum]
MLSALVPKNLLPLLPLTLLATTLALPATSFAETRRDQVTADSSVAASERQVVMGISRLGLERTRFNFPVFYTPHEGETRPYGHWSVEINQDYADATLAEYIRFVIPSRFDRLVFENDEATLTTATQVFEDLDIGRLVPELDSRTRSYREFRNYLLNHLNTHIAPVMQDVMGAAAEARYEEMNALEKNTFITQRARQTGMPARVLEGLVSSSYAMGFYLPRLEGRMFISQQERQRYDGSTYYVYSTSLQAPLETRLVVFHYNGEEFTVDLQLSAEADGIFEGMAQQMSGTASVTTERMPRERDAQQIFDEAFQDSFKDSTLALSTQLKEDRRFAVSTPVLDPTPGRIILEVGNQEDIRVDQPFTFRRVIDQQEEVVGWGRVRKPGRNCLVLPADERTPSEGALLAGDVEAYDLAVEHPWTGVYGRIGASQSGTELTINDEATGAGATSMLELGFQGNLGYLFNASGMSEVWMNLDLGLGANSSGEETFDYLEGSAAARLRLGFEKRFHLGAGTYVSAGADFGAEAHSFTNLNDEDKNFDLTTYNVIPRAELGYYFTPNVKIYAGAAYNQPFGTQYDEYDDGSIITDELAMTGGLNVQAGIAFHLGFAGPFASMMSHPSRECDYLRQASLNTSSNAPSKKR